MLSLSSRERFDSQVWTFVQCSLWPRCVGLAELRLVGLLSLSSCYFQHRLCPLLPLSWGLRDTGVSWLEAVPELAETLAAFPVVLCLESHIFSSTLSDLRPCRCPFSKLELSLVNPPRHAFV